MSTLLNELNERQRRAVCATEGPCMIVAGPGAGKTRVLVHRIAYLCQKGVAPDQVLVLTFTNKAAQEMRHRLIEMIGAAEASKVWMGTFHSLFARILRLEATSLNLIADFTIYDREDSKRLIKQAINKLKLKADAYPLNTVLKRISEAKNALIDAHAYGQANAWRNQDAASNKPHLHLIYGHYQAACCQHHGLDFDDLLLQTHHLFKDHPLVAQKYQERFAYLLVDEFQDSNKVQYAILKVLAQQHGNLSIVGDDAQSIYAFRGADVAHMLNFADHFPGATIIKLEENYRSTKQIVGLANGLIAHNHQHPKKLFTQQKGGNQVLIKELYSDEQEAHFVVDKIVEAHQNQRQSYNHFAVLYRTNQQSRLFEELLGRYQIPYRVVGSIAFYQRKEVKDLLAYFRLLVNPHDLEAIARATSIPKQGIGPATLEQAREVAAAAGTGIWETLCNSATWSKAKVGQAIANFVGLIQRHRQALAHQEVAQVVHNLAQESGFLPLLAQDQTIEGIGRYENAVALLHALQTFMQSPLQKNPTLGDFLQQISLDTTQEAAAQTAADTVTLMTVHSAKGLEFGHVFIVGMEEQCFPSWRMAQDAASLEEERRLFFVAITRAKADLTISYATRRFQHGRHLTTRPSRFLRELDPTYLVSPPVQLSTKSYKPPLSIQPTPLKSPAQFRPPTKGLPLMALQVGLVVLHPKFGRGKVTSLLHGLPREEKVVVDFNQLGTKTLVVAYANLQKG